MEKKRITYLDLAKGVGIILVVLGHMENIAAGLRTWISSFHMPLFFMISGMLIALKNEDQADTGAMVKKKAKGILVPYMWFSLIYIPIDIMNLYINNVDKHTFIQNILDSATFSGVSVMWFLPALFIAEIVALLIIKTVKEKITDNTSEITAGIDNSKSVSKESTNKGNNNLKKLYIISAALALLVSIAAFLIWSLLRPSYDANSANYAVGTILGFVRVLFRGICMSFHVVTGYVLFRLMETVDSYIADKASAKIDKKGMKTEMVSNSLSGRLLSRENRINNEVKGMNLAAGVILAVINISLCIKNGAVDNHFLTLNNLFYYYICAVIGSLSIVLICKGFDSIKPIDFLGKNSLIIMATHLQCYLLYAGILVAIAIDAYVTRAKSYIYMFNSVLFTMLFEVIVIYAINNLFPFIVGKGSIKEWFIFKKIFSKNS